MKKDPSTLNQSCDQPSRHEQHLHHSITDFHIQSQYHMKLAKICKSITNSNAALSYVTGLDFYAESSIYEGKQ